MNSFSVFTVSFVCMCVIFSVFLRCQWALQALACLHWLFVNKFKASYNNAKWSSRDSFADRGLSSTNGSPRNVQYLDSPPPKLLDSKRRSHRTKGSRTLKSTNVSVCFRGICRLPSAFVFLRWFKLAHISIQVCTFHEDCIPWILSTRIVSLEECQTKSFGMNLLLHAIFKFCTTKRLFNIVLNKTMKLPCYCNNIENSRSLWFSFTTTFWNLLLWPQNNFL